MIEILLEEQLHQEMLFKACKTTRCFHEICYYRNKFTDRDLKFRKLTKKAEPRRAFKQPCFLD